MGLSPDFNVSWIVGVPWLALLSAAYLLWKRQNARMNRAPASELSSSS